MNKMAYLIFTIAEYPIMFAVGYLIAKHNKRRKKK
jgi:hypothetical protein